MRQPAAAPAIDPADALAYMVSPNPARRPAMAQTDMTLDARNLNCPLPVLKLKKAIAGLKVGGTIEVLATDPGAEGDFEAFCMTTGNRLLERGSAEGVYRFVIKRMT